MHLHNTVLQWMKQEVNDIAYVSSEIGATPS